MPDPLAGVALSLRPANPSFSFDANGNATSSSDGFAGTYDAADRTTSLKVPGGSPVSFSYRGPGQTERVSMSPATRIAAPCAVLSGCPPSTTSLGTTARFEHSALGITAETDDGIITHYTRDPYGQLINERSPSGIYDYLFDGHGSVIALVADCCGYWLEGTYGYDPYGQLTSMTSSHAAVVHNPWRYAGAYQDGTGLYKMGARYYDPSTGRFTQQDPIVNPFDPGSWNRYVYTGDDPVNYSDPSGLKKHKCDWLHPWDCVTNYVTCVAAATWNDVFYPLVTAKWFPNMPPMDLSDIGAGAVVIGLDSMLEITAESAGVTVGAGAATVGALVGGAAILGYGVYEGMTEC